MDLLDQKEISRTFDEFLNEHSLFYTFKEWIEERGYKLEELGIEDDY